MRLDAYLLAASFLCTVPDRVPHSDEPPPIKRISLAPGHFLIERDGDSVVVKQGGRTVVREKAIYLSDGRGQCCVDIGNHSLRVNGYLMFGDWIEFESGGLSVRSVSVPPGGVVVTSPSVKFEWRQ